MWIALSTPSGVRLQMLERDVEAVLDCLESGWLTMGPRIQEFEHALCDYVGSPHVATVSSGTAALHLALLAAKVGPGDEVLVPALTSVATANAVRYTGAEAVWCDIRGPHDLNLDLDDAARRITPRTKALVAVHLCGYPANLLGLRQLCDSQGLVLVEDCAQALGAVVGETGRKVGTFGDLAAFSFSSPQGLYVGEGGAVATADDGLDRRVRLLRSHAMTSGTWDRHRGHQASYDVIDVGFNYRMDEPRAALGTSRLASADQEIAARRGLVAGARAAIAAVPGLAAPWDDRAVACSSHASLPLVLADSVRRDRLREELRAVGLDITWYPVVPMPNGAGSGAMRVADIGTRHCFLPLTASMDGAIAEALVDAVRRTLG